MRLIEFKTNQVTTFRTLFDSLKEILLDISICFTKDSIKILRMDTAKTIIVDLKIDTENLEHYYCHEEDPKGITIDLSMIQLFKIIKTCATNGILTFIYDSDDKSILTIMIENVEKSTQTKYNLNLIDVNQEDLNMTKIDHESIVIIPTLDFQKIIKDMKQFSELIDIKCCKNELVFCCSGDSITQETKISSTTAETTISFVKESNKIIQGLYNAKHLISFIKCTNLCTCLKLSFSNDYPLCISYDVGTLGKITFILATFLGDDD